MEQTNHMRPQTGCASGRSISHENGDALGRTYRWHMVVLATAVAIIIALLDIDWLWFGIPCHWLEGGYPSVPAGRIVDYRIYALLEDVLYSFPLICSIVGAFLFGMIVPSSCWGRLWRVAIVALCLISGLIPVFAINQYQFYVLGVPGFMLPYTMAIVLWGPASDAVSCRDSGTAAINPLLVLSGLVFIGVCEACSLLYAYSGWQMLLCVPLFAYMLAVSMSPAECDKMRRFLSFYLCVTVVALLFRVVMYMSKYDDLCAPI